MWLFRDAGPTGLKLVCQHSSTNMPGLTALRPCAAIRSNHSARSFVFLLEPLETRVKLKRTRQQSCATLRSEEHNHRTFRNLFVHFPDVINVHHDAAKGQTAWARVIPLLVPAVKADTASEWRSFKRRLTLTPLARYLLFLLTRNQILRSASDCVEGIRIIYNLRRWVGPADGPG
jgi:hypothetical protein